ncbi:MAG: tRNA 2-thiouridine(34) synthase MnmA, partial [Spirochaetales bacterium]|nr:tRNA 2-thiouridine(34) synthase MnmA [Spirochaetales bacterium]
VAEKDAKNNTVTLGENHELSTPELVARDLNLIAVEKIDSPMRVTAKIRYNQKDQGALLLPGADNSVIVRFDEPQRAVAPGQAVVFYQGERVIGGGTI